MLSLMSSSALSQSSAPSIGDLHNNYGAIFQTGNRNAASHLWSSWILNQAKSLDTSGLTELFTGFCPVSGSPVTPSAYNTYRYSLPSLAGGHAVGFIHHCCAPCVCDTLDMIHADTLTVQLADGPRKLTFAVIGDPCAHASALQTPFNDPFSGSSTTLGATAPEVRCDASGRLHGATFSDHGAVVIGLLPEAPPLGPGPTEPTPGRVTTADGVSFQDAREFAPFCTERASSGYSSGMGLIFREVAKITSLDAPVAPAAAASAVAALSAAPAAAAAASPFTAASAKCDHLLPAERRQQVAQWVASEPVLMLAMRHMRCTNAAAERLEQAGACFRLESWEEASEPLWRYLQCVHPHELVNGMQMHSYVYIGGAFVGNGFKLAADAMPQAALEAKLTAARARRECHTDCDAIAPASERANLAEMLRQPLAMLGWSGCPCTNIARQRFESVGACYLQQVWPTDDAPLYKHLQCKYGAHHHSFVFVGGKFVGDGFALGEERMPRAEFDAAVAASGASLQCQREGDKNLVRRPLQSCTQSNDGSTTGWTRTGSCNWDPSDSGYHEVCVTMSDKFLRESAEHDANDLTSVVRAGGHWCICAWAFAAAVQRDPAAHEGITLDCDRTNLKLREVYDMHIDAGTDLTSPSGASYKAKAALDAVNRLCPETTAAAAAASTTAAAPAKAVVAAAAAAAPAVGRAGGGGGGGARGGGARRQPRPPASPLSSASTGLAALLVGVAAGCLVLGHWVLARRRRRADSEATLVLCPTSAPGGDFGGDVTLAARKKTDALDELGCYDSGFEEEPHDAMRVGPTPTTRASVV